MSGMIENAIRARLEETSTSRYKLAESIGESVPRSTVYRVADGGSTSVENLEAILGGLGLVIVPAVDVRRPQDVQARGYTLPPSAVARDPRSRSRGRRRRGANRR